jgi:hypothetical protein
MPFDFIPQLFNDPTLNSVYDVGAVYGLFRQTGPNQYLCLYVGETTKLRRRLQEHYKNPPIEGITHFSAEVIPPHQTRAVRAKQLNSELLPL